MDALQGELDRLQQSLRDAVQERIRQIREDSAQKAREESERNRIRQGIEHARSRVADIAGKVVQGLSSGAERALSSLRGSVEQASNRVAEALRTLSRDPQNTDARDAYANAVSGLQQIAQDFNEQGGLGGLFNAQIDAALEEIRGAVRDLQDNAATARQK